MKKIELDILFLYLIEAITILFFFKESILNIIIGFFIAYLINYFLKKVKFNNFSKVFYLFILFIASILLLYRIFFFISYNILKNYSIFLIIFSFLLTSFFTITKQNHSYIKTVQLSIYFFIAIKILKIFLIIPLIKINNFNIINQLSINYNIITISLIILLINHLFFLITNYLPSIKRFSIIILNPIIIKITAILVIGDALFNRYKYPYVSYLKNIRYLNFIERMEGILSFEYLLCFFILFSFILFSIKIIILSLKKVNK